MSVQRAHPYIPYFDPVFATWTFHICVLNVKGALNSFRQRVSLCAGFGVLSVKISPRSGRTLLKANSSNRSHKKQAVTAVWLCTACSTESHVKTPSLSIRQRVTEWIYIIDVHLSETAEKICLRGDKRTKKLGQTCFYSCIHFSFRTYLPAVTFRPLFI